MQLKLGMHFCPETKHSHVWRSTPCSGLIDSRFSSDSEFSFFSSQDEAEQIQKGKKESLGATQNNMALRLFTGDAVSSPATPDWAQAPEANEGAVRWTLQHGTCLALFFCLNTYLLMQAFGF